MFCGYAQDTGDTVRHGKAKRVLEQVKEHVGIAGWIDAQYAYDYIDPNSQSSVMQIRRARFEIKGNLSKWVDFRLQADFANSPKLIDAFVKVNLCKYVNIQVGQFKIPFSLENKLSPLDLELTENAQVISALSGYKDVTGISSYANGREIGLMFTGTLASATVREEKIPILKYGVGLFGGNGINVKTDNMPKDVSARLEFCPFVKGLTLSASGYFGWYDMRHEGLSTGIDGRRYRYAAGAEYNDTKLIVRGEYVRGLTDFAFLDPIPNPISSEDYYLVAPTRTEGFYLVASRWFDFGWGKESLVRQKLRPILRFDFYNYDLEHNSSASERPSLFYSAGIEWWPERHLRVQLNYTLKQRYNIDQLGHNVTTMITVRF